LRFWSTDQFADGEGAWNMIKTAKVFAAVVAVMASGLGIHAFLPPVSKSEISRVTAGTPAAQVERTLGRPAVVLEQALFGSEAWRYQVPLRFGWVDVFFDDERRVIHHNFEMF
jgi:hypothetical protein